MAAATSTTDRGAIAPSTVRLLLGGVVAGPLFLGASTIQALLRDGFDITKVAFSSLSVGTHGWIQMTNFVLTGLLCLGCAIGIRRQVPTGKASGWGPRLLMLFGIGQIIAGLFKTDPAMGFPPGTPDGLPEDFTTHAIIHNISAPVAFLSAAIACVVFSRRFGAQGNGRWRLYSLATGIAAPLVAIPPHASSAGLRLAAATGIVYLWLAAYVFKLLRESR
jgi:hypothetical membrane protein